MSNNAQWHYEKVGNEIKATLTAEFTMSQDLAKETFAWAISRKLKANGGPEAINIDLLLAGLPQQGILDLMKILEDT